ncbi:hypothetical protein [Synechococcus sp. PCC 7336]|uniref:hypothetical protein n=1 Tax=Synechococcus sp. PCC 7336 TaxID=195250 RepID=UPI00034789E4|nr:hypothetical protein [Synechococcus sp. PCC 7336]
MTTVAILPESDSSGNRRFRAISGDKQSTGKTAGEALDALTAQIEYSEASPFILIQSFQPDSLFTAVQQQRLTELMQLWRAARDRSEPFPPALQAELEHLTEAELKAATARSANLMQQLDR